MADDEVQFRYFTKLPVEIQFMIWDLHRSSIDPIRHIFRVTEKRRRQYAAIRNRPLEIVQRLVPKNDDGQSALPYERKIRFTGVTSIARPRSIHSRFPKNGGQFEDLFYLLDREYHRKTPSAFVYADLERDFFCFEPSSLTTSSTHMTEEWFRFIRNPIGNSNASNQASKLPEDHWIFSVRNLVLYISRKDMKVSEWDRKVLLGMKQLKNVHLVVTLGRTVDRRCSARKLWRSCNVRRYSPGAKRSKLFLFEEDYSPSWASSLSSFGQGTANNVRAVFAQHGLNPRVRIAVDNYAILTYSGDYLRRRTVPSSRRRYFGTFL